MRLSKAILTVIFGLLLAVAVQAQIIIGIDPSIHAGPPPVNAPVVHNLTVQLSIPINTDFTVGTPTVDNTPLTGCVITAGNGGSNYAIDNSTCAITVSNPTGKNNLTTMGTDILTVRATNTGGTGEGTVTIVKWLDGATFATCTTPQYPTLLAGLTRAPWQVAGVDYCVGPADGTTFKIPSPSNLPAGSTLTGTTILYGTANGVIDGWNFTGFTLDINANNVTVKNSIFGNNGQAQLLRLENIAQVFTFTYNNVNGTGLTGAGGTLSTPCTATTVTYKYNWIQNAPQNLFQSCAGTIGTQFNLLENPGLVTAGSAFTQETGNPGGTTTLLTQFNTARLGNGKTVNGLAFTPNLATYAGASITDYNTMLASAGTTSLTSDTGVVLITENGNVLTAEGGAVGTVLNNGVGPSNNTGFTLTGTFEAKNNYAGYINGASGVFLHCGTATFTSYANNVNMVTGAQIPIPAACPGNPPVVTAQTYSIPSNSPIGTFVGTINATNTPTSYSLVGCNPGCAGFFSLPSPTSNQIQTAVTFPDVAATYTLAARADNAFGFGQANETINITVVTPPPGVPVVTAQVFTISAPASTGDVVGTILATNSPTSYSVDSCSGCTDWFTINNSTGVITVTAVGAVGMPGTVDKQTVHPVIRAFNSAGPSGQVTDTVNAYADGSPGAPGVAAQFPDILGDRHVTAVALNQTGFGYQEGDIVQAYSVGTGTGSGICSTWPKWQVTHAGTTGRILADGLTLVNSGTCSRVPTVQVPLTCINCQGSQASVNITWSTNSITLAARPPWKVAGVDYGIGPPTGVAVKRPGIDAAPGCVSVNTGSHEFTVSTPNCIIEGWDFTRDGGWHVAANCGSDNIIVRNNNFKATTNTPDFISLGFSGCSPGATVTNNIFDSNSRPGDDTVGDFRGGTGIFKYNWFKDSYCDQLKANAADDTGAIPTNYDLRFNIFNNFARHPPGVECHSDIIQTGDNGFNNDVRLQFNLMYEDSMPCNDETMCGGQGFIMNGNNHGATFINEFLDFNTLIARNFAFEVINSCVIFAPNFVSNSLTVRENYSDAAPATHCLWNQGTGSGPLIYNGNINMRTGGTCAQNAVC